MLRINNIIKLIFNVKPRKTQTYVTKFFLSQHNNIIGNNPLVKKILNSDENGT